MRALDDNDLLVLKRGFDVAPHLGTNALSRIVEVHERLGSTNERAQKLARSGACHGTAVVAFEQSEGRGRRGRQWHSPAGAGLYCSFVLRPELVPRMAPTLTVLAGVAVCRALKKLGAEDVGIKWPNDILVSTGGLFGRKIAGILVETYGDATRIEHAIMGIGVNLREVERPLSIQDSATSVRAISGRSVSHAELLGALANELEPRLTEAETSGFATVTKEWVEHAIGAGQVVSIQIDGEEVFGTLCSVAEDGALRLQLADGHIRDFYRGELLIPGVPRPGDLAADRG